MSPRHLVLEFVALAFAISWIGGVVAAAILQSVTPEAWERITLLPAKFGPSVAGLVMAARYGGREAVLRLLRSATRLRAHSFATAVALGLPALVWGSALVIVDQLGGGVDWRVVGSITPVAVAQALATFVFLGGGFGEELGWRGFALPMLQRIWSPLQAGLGIGVVWAVWHYPMYVLGGENLSPVWLFTTLVVAISLVMTAMFNRTQGNVWLAVLFHGSVNAAEALTDGAVAAGDEATLERAITGVFVAIALALVVAGLRGREAAT